MTAKPTSPERALNAAPTTAPDTAPNTAPDAHSGAPAGVSQRADVDFAEHAPGDAQHGAPDGVQDQPHTAPAPAPAPAPQSEHDAPQQNEEDVAHPPEPPKAPNAGVSPEQDPGRRIRTSLNFPVVGLGASAGGLSAVGRLLETMPAAPGMAFVVILHLSPEHESRAAEILSSATRMRVIKVTGPLPIERNTVYVIPPTRGLTMVDGYLRLTDLERQRGRHVVIDLFFRTLANAHQARAIAVVLSGTGADGSAGIGEIKEQGGIVMAQSPNDAEFDGMPSNAIATGKVDVVLPASDIGEKLMDVWQNQQRIEMPDDEPASLHPLPPSAPELAEKSLRRIMELLQARTGHDFKHYKRATVLRRIERRLQINSLPHLTAYEQYLEQHPQETPLLLSDMLIGVTNFFRDRDAFEALEREVLPTLFDESLKDEQLRAWVAGCSSGEEAYTLLMLLHQEAGNARHPRTLQVFATDIDDAAIARGREGRYPESVVTDIPPSLMRKYLLRDRSGYCIAKPLRSTVLFAQHNILRDPPFSKLDLVSCRNLLIYLNRDVQKEILQMFHFALRPGGYLFLGSSETADATGRLFTVVDKRHRIYRANSVLRAPRALPKLPIGQTAQRPLLQPPERPGKPGLVIADLHHQMLRDFAPPSVLIKADGEILHSHHAENYLRFAPGVPTQNLLALVQPELRALMRTALFQHAHGQEVWRAPDTRIVRNGTALIVRFDVRAVRHFEWPGDLLLVVFYETEEKTDAATTTPAAANDPLLRQMESELQRKDDQLQSIVSQYETAVEDLKSSNEELQAINEELRSATEELETSKEELQSTNEELITVNNELKVKVEETAEINDDLQNLITATEIATIFVDRDMRIKRFTPAATKIFNIIPGDVGRSLLDITHRLNYESLAEDAMTAFSSLRPFEREVSSSDERWYLARLLPYRTGEDRIDGAVLTFVDVTTRLSAERTVDIDRERMQLIASSMPDFAIMTLDEEGRITSWSAGAERLFRYSEGEVLGSPVELIYTPDDRQAGVPHDEMRTARQQGRAVDERWHLRKDGSRVYVSGIMTPMRLGRLRGFAKIARDMTDRQQEEATRSLALTTAMSAAQHAHEASHLKDEFLAVMSHELKHPLNLIQLNAQMLISMPELKDLPTVVRIGKTIQQTVRSQARIIDDLLDISRTRTGKLVLNVSQLDLADALQESLAWAAQHAQEKGVHFEADVTDEPLLVAADPVRVEQVALNLLSNAIKFTPPGGRITVRVTRDGDDAVLEVADTGCGITPKFLQQVFELFKQAEPQPSREHGGLGIGLALVRDLVELQGGTVEATSPGLEQGATFRVRLPMTQRTDFGELDPADGAMSLRGLRILYVEDNPDALTMLTTVLRIEGAEVFPADSGQAALQIAETQLVDLVIADIGMPRMDGYELIGQLRKRPATARVPAIALTGYGRPKDVTRAISGGFDGHLNKPVELRALRTLVKKLRLDRS